MHSGIQQNSLSEIIGLFFSVLAVYQMFLVKSVLKSAMRGQRTTGTTAKTDVLKQEGERERERECSLFFN